MFRHRDRGDAARLLCFLAFCLELLFSLLPDIIMAASREKLIDRIGCIYVNAKT